MSTGISESIEKEVSLAASYVSVLNESVDGWVIDKASRTVLDDLQHGVTSLTTLYTVIDECSRHYTLAVANDRIPYNEELDDRIKALWRSWIQAAKSVDSRFRRVGLRASLLIDKYSQLRHQLESALEYEKQDFDHHAKAIIAMYHIPYELFKDDKFPQEFWDSPE